MTRTYSYVVVGIIYIVGTVQDGGSAIKYYLVRMSLLLNTTYICCALYAYCTADGRVLHSTLPGTTVWTEYDGQCTRIYNTKTYYADLCTYLRLLCSSFHSSLVAELFDSLTPAAAATAVCCCASALCASAVDLSNLSVARHGWWWSFWHILTVSTFSSSCCRIY